MQNNFLLEQIWCRRIKVRNVNNISYLGSILEVLLATKVVSLIDENEHSAPYALSERSQLLPDVLLGDVLFEEMDLEVPANAIILVESAAFSEGESYDSRQLGDALASVLMDVAAFQGFGEELFKPEYPEMYHALQTNLNSNLNNIRNGAV
jgi:hypothetical protein